MPTYEYACANCDTTHEVQQKMSDPTLTDCPSCGESGLRKLFSGVGIHFKGSGFYRTDSRSGSTGGSTGSSTGATSTTSTSAPSTPAPSAPSTSTPASTPAASPAS